MEHKPDFFEKLLMGFLKKNLIFSEVFFWELLIGILGFVPGNEQLIKVIGVVIGVRILTVILFQLPQYFIWLLKILSIGEKTGDKEIVPSET